ncbi:MAG: carboxypeptidase-like regulatory domain-containing protein [Chitinophagia bacterium]|jgi:hypothetical protein|nr:carboxypeptidase-like regulatory domain-containing protein [Chitinophagia bacterium]
MIFSQSTSTFYKIIAIVITVFLLGNSSYANVLQGSIRDAQGKEVPFASILIKKTKLGTTANSKGVYNLNIAPGDYVIVCQSISYKTVEKKVKIKEAFTTLDFILTEQQYELTEVVVSNKAEDPAYEIIRNAIKKREAHLKEYNNFKCQVYLKGLIQLNDYPKKFLGDTVDFQDGDTNKAKILFLSETFADYSVSNKQKKVEVKSTKVSGRSNGFGLGNPNIISFYENSINIGEALNPRGYVSPISDNALFFYKYKYMGSFYENGMEVTRIKVMPRRKQEPLFSGFINIIEGQWRLYSTQLNITKDQQLQLIDSISYEQIYMPIGSQWVIKQQVNYLSGNFFKFKFNGSIVQVFNEYELDKQFDKKYFTNVVIKYLDSSNKKSLQYWDSARPLPLLEKEAIDFVKKDSLEKIRNTPAYLDSIDRRRNKMNINNLFLRGYNYNKQSQKIRINVDPLLYAFPINFNPAEGRVMNFKATWNKQLPQKNNISFSPSFRYGLEKKKWYTSFSGSYGFPTKARSLVSASFGRTVFQFNNSNPISEIDNTASTLKWGNNFMKTYEAGFFKINYTRNFGQGVNLNLEMQYQDRTPLDNVVNDLKGHVFTPNYPTALMTSNILPHQSLVTSLNITWRPGTKYLELPNRLIGLRSPYPSFNFNYTQGLHGILGSDVDFAKWKCTISHNMNLKLLGKLNARFIVGGFVHDKKVFAPDFQHYLGNQIDLNQHYMTGFQMLPYYEFSNHASLYSESHLEYHLNGFLSNKIPLFNKLNWFFVIGANTLNIKSKPNYYETFFSIENIFKIARIDFVNSIREDQPNATGIKFSIVLLR